jgi:hypothetical protein
LLYFTGKEELVTVDQASVIIGAGKLGTALANLGLGDDVILRRGDTIPLEIENNKCEKLSAFPIYVAVSFAIALICACLCIWCAHSTYWLGISALYAATNSQLDCMVDVAVTASHCCASKQRH